MGAEQRNLRKRPRAGRLSGPPGAGKSTCLRYMAYQWSVDFLEKTQESDTVDSDECTLMVYLPARSIRGSVRDAIRNQLRCGEKDADLLMAHVDQGKRVAVLLDGIDEIRDAEIIENLREYVRTRKERGGEQVLVAARTDLSQLPSRSFDRFLILQGFSPEQGKEYIRKYFSMDRPHNVTIQTVMEYIKKHESKLEGVLMSPLQLYIFCGLTSIGVLKLEDDNIYNVVNLFEPLEKFLIKRESEKRGGLLVTEKDSQNFYCMCLYALLADVRRFSKSYLDKFNISLDYLVFLINWDELGSNAEFKTYYEFKHEAIFEYFGSKFIQNSPLAFLQSMILSICCKTSLRNVQKMMMQIVAKREADSMLLYLAIIRAIIIFQWEENDIFQWEEDYDPYESLKFECDSEIDTSESEIEEAWESADDGDNSTSKSNNDMDTSGSEIVEASGSADNHALSTIKIRLSNLKHRIKTASVDEMLLSHQDVDKVREADAIWEVINRAFDSEELRVVGLFGGLGKNGTLQHIVDCLKVCTPQQQEEIIRRSLYCLLPCEYMDKE